MLLCTVLYILAGFQTSADALPVVTYPINSQVPPVARLSQPFSYTFPISTFSSYLPITYTLSDAPSWLSLDGSTRTLSGTPAYSDVDGDTITAFAVELTASDQSGSVSLNSTFVISKNPAPVVNIPISSQLPHLGLFSAPATLLLHQSTPFRLDFQPNTFSGNGNNAALYYYATTTANTPLPSWLTFDAPTLSFSGQTPDYPSLIGIQIIASDVEGFSGSSVSFEMAIGIHTLAFNSQTMIIDAIPGAEIVFSGLASNIELDGQPTDISSITLITAQTPSWLDFDNSTLTISGRTPMDAKPCNISVYATDIYGDVAEATILVGIGPMALPTSKTSAKPHATITPVPTFVASQRHFPRKIIAAIVVPVLLLVLAILLAVLCYQLRRRAAYEENRRPSSREKFYFSANPNAEEFAEYVPNVPPKCLRLDALKYEDDHWQRPCMREYNSERCGTERETSMEKDEEGSFVSSALVRESLYLPSGGGGSRTSIEYGQHKSKPSWGSTLSSIFPTVRSRTDSISRQASNYSPCSDRGHGKRSGRMWSPDTDRGIHSYGQRAAESIVNSRDSTISFRALINFPILSDTGHNQWNAESESSNKDISPTKPTRRRSRSLPPVPPLYSTRSYDRPLSMLALAGRGPTQEPGKDDQELDGESQAGVSSSCVTLTAKEEKSHRSSSLNFSASSELLSCGEISHNHNGRVRESLLPSISQTQGITLVERKPSKRSGSLALLGTETTRRSRQLAEQAITTSADVMMYPETAMALSDIAIPNRTGENNISPDPFESSFWSAREGTRQLKDYIRGLLRRTWTQDSIRSHDPSDSLFESARGSMSSMHHSPGVRDSRDIEMKRRVEDQRHESLLHDADSEWSWETHYTQQDDRATVIGDESNNSPSTTVFGTLPAGSSNLGTPSSCIRSKDMKIHAGSERGCNACGSSVDEYSIKGASAVILSEGEEETDDIA